MYRYDWLDLRLPTNSWNHQCLQLRQLRQCKKTMHRNPPKTCEYRQEEENQQKKWIHVEIQWNRFTWYAQ